MSPNARVRTHIVQLATHAQLGETNKLPSRDGEHCGLEIGRLGDEALLGLFKVDHVPNSIENACSQMSTPMMGTPSVKAHVRGVAEGANDPKSRLIASASGPSLRTPPTALGSDEPYLDAEGAREQRGLTATVELDGGLESDPLLGGAGSRIGLFSLVQGVDIGLMVFLMVEDHDLLDNVWLEGIVGVREGWKRLIRTVSGRSVHKKSNNLRGSWLLLAKNR
ncbi:13967_t:CDS:2 [Acaulospora colombiana]|uniref:13967_t:CDS:1 n=1 Tax=Acaulospora colombiana TaxID=27376 RepID=A0ACA9MEK7_9GLOM|nr:13967_t:CDS:2 [Acaulospora colombiana]